MKKRLKIILNIGVAVACIACNLQNIRLKSVEAANLPISFALQQGRSEVLANSVPQNILQVLPLDRSAIVDAESLQVAAAPSTEADALLQNTAVANEYLGHTSQSAHTAQSLALGIVSSNFTLIAASPLQRVASVVITENTEQQISGVLNKPEISSGMNEENKTLAYNVTIQRLQIVGESKGFAISDSTTVLRC